MRSSECGTFSPSVLFTRSTSAAATHSRLCGAPLPPRLPPQEVTALAIQGLQLNLAELREYTYGFFAQLAEVRWVLKRFDMS